MKNSGTARARGRFALAEFRRAAFGPRNGKLFWMTGRGRLAAVRHAGYLFSRSAPLSISSARGRANSMRDESRQANMAFSVDMQEMSDAA